MSDIRKAAEERYPSGWSAQGPYTNWSDHPVARNAFIEGAEWMRELAAREADSVGHHWAGAGATAAFEVAIAIRKIGEKE